ncbi:MAG: vanadium-dependent haloperoxidase [Chitinophagaceae bacterium]|nr:vanadium-dependent haloperoxidase [Chitinophagaceae bacterium]
MKKLIVFVAAVIWINCGYGQKRMPFVASDYVTALKHATDVMVNDVTSPVAASRYYGYINLAANETVALFDKQQPYFAGVVKGLNTITVDDHLIKKSDSQLAIILALYKSAASLLPSGYLLQKNLDSLKLFAEKRKLSVEKINATVELVDKVVEQVLKYASADGFVRLSGFRRFTPSTGDEYWQPTAPGFISAIEPYWCTLRPFILDSCSQFSCPPPNKYSTDTNSLFYKDLKEVYEIGKNLSKEQSEIAMFWDCNPFALQQVGHLEFGIKKISPGGHWMGITGIACKKQNLSLSKTAYVHAMVSIAMSDAFIACWNDKYKYNRVRPETVIKKLIDRNWSPLLQTPPFPEYTSGHSVISATASTILTHIFGDQFSFTDDTEEEFGLPSRKFNSFSDAAKEAAISRLYGGIHFRDAIENGVKEGEQIGKFVITRSPDSQTNNKNNGRAISAKVKNKD